MHATGTWSVWIGVAAASAANPAFGQATTQPAQSANGKPNIILIVADDLGYADLGCQGAKDLATPNIDTLAANGVRLTNGYVSCPVCSPTRAGLMTGRYQQRFGHEFNPGPAETADIQFGLPLTERTMADDLKAAGYATGAIGKWHLGYEPQFHPLKRGFDEHFGFPGGAHAYLDARSETKNPIRRGTEPVNEQEYLTDAFTREAVAFVNRHAKEPFFLYLTYNAVHTPQEVTDKYLRRFPAISDPKRQRMAAMLSAMDDGVGQVLEALNRHGIEDNTLVFFISDNGGPTAGNGSRNDPLSGFKGQVLEGGIRVPYVIQWKRGLPAGKVYEQPAISLDILPTALAAAGVAVPADRGLDGVNLLPFLRRELTGVPHDRLFWRYGPNMAIRQGDYKLVIQKNSPAQLFNLVSDVGEKHDLAADKPEMAAQLKTALDAWNATLSEPRWKGGGPKARRGSQANETDDTTKAAGDRKGRKNQAQPDGDQRQNRRDKRRGNTQE